MFKNKKYEVNERVVFYCSEGRRVGNILEKKSDNIYRVIDDNVALYIVHAKQMRKIKKEKLGKKLWFYKKNFTSGMGFLVTDEENKVPKDELAVVYCVREILEE